jgi:hypothetical protein
MYELIQLLLSTKEGALVLLLAVGGPGVGIGFAFNSLGEAVKRSLAGRDARLKDEQEHRQKLERDAAKAKRELEAAGKLEDVLGVLIADRSVADSVRERIDELHPPPTRVEEEVEEPSPTRKRVKQAR